MNASILYDPYSAHSSNRSGWRDWACWVPGRTHEDLLHQTLASPAPIPTDGTVVAAPADSRIDVAAQAVRVQ